MTFITPYLVEHVLHGHEEALSLVQTQFVMLVVATCKHTGNISDESTTIGAAPTLTHHHVIRRQRHFHRLTTADMNTTHSAYNVLHIQNSNDVRQINK